ncbi:hybrid sensor histidine kinase/response regulator [Tepidibacter mesophilus]|uniref:hybrid sensor histidine kinase/response regulator n=1 Tax=Tepidibacter mesophilus TaxID=655607 RepID=UPI000C068810|nr:response regulator [Tepidibacter mesophilus]
MHINDAEFFKKLRSTFTIEAYEHLRIISLSLIELEKMFVEENKKTIVETIHREFHSLKGASRAVSIKEIESICHTMENIFSKIKKETLELNEQMFDIFNESIDIIEDILSSHEGEIKDISVIMGNLKKIECGNLGKIDSIKTETVNLDTGINQDVNIKPKYSQEDNNIIKASKNIKNEEDVKMQNINTVKVTEGKTSEIVRVSKSKLDSLLLQGEEMAYAKLSSIKTAKEIKEIKELIDLWKKEKEYTFIEMLKNNVDALLKSAENEAKTIEMMTDTFIEDIKSIMLLPFYSIIEMFPKMVRDLSRHIGKEIEFISEGTEIEIDRRILEEMKDPLMHIIRNCIDHGIEKSSRGTINLNIVQVSSDTVKIEISDDGVGIDIEKLKEKAIINNILTQGQVNAIDDESAKMLIFKSGISTSDIITDISGRGLGLAIVYEKVQKLEGSITVRSEKAKGTTFTIILPITISTNRGIILKVEKQDFVIPTGKVEKVMRVKKDEVRIIENRATISLDGYIIPIVRLKDILEIQDKRIEESSGDIISILVVNDMENKIALSVDEIIIEQEVLVKRFNKQLKKVRNIAGATILGSGQVVPILAVQDLIKSSLKNSNKSLSIVGESEKDIIQNKRIIVVEDSITSRTLLKNILESHGYIVKTAVNGLKGWELIKSEKFDIVITDVEMPEMDGFELTSKIRNDSQTCEIPVILVTSLESREDKERGIDVGASAYIVKSDFRQNNLLETIKRLI